MNQWIRARSDEQKQSRETQILMAAGILFRQHDFKEVTLVTIAKAAGFTRSNIYRYFGSKEEIFLVIMEQEFDQFAKRVNKVLNSQECQSPEDLVRILVGNLIQQETLLELLPIMNSSLERYSGKDQVLAFKQALHSTVGSMIVAIRLVFPRLSEAAILDILMGFISLAAGLYPLTKLTPVHQEIRLEHPELSSLFFEFQERMETLLLRIVQGVLKQ